jgi:hypothetical protein
MGILKVTRQSFTSNLPPAVFVSYTKTDYGSALKIQSPHRTQIKSYIKFRKSAAKITVMFKN